MTVAGGLRAEGRGCEGAKWESRRVCDGSLLKKDCAIGEEERSTPRRVVGCLVDGREVGRRRWRKGGCKSCNLEKASKREAAWAGGGFGLQSACSQRVDPRPPMVAGMHVNRTGNRVAT